MNSGDNKESIPQKKKEKKERKKASKHTDFRHISHQAKYDYPGRAASNFVGGHHKTPLPVQGVPCFLDFSLQVLRSTATSYLEMFLSPAHPASHLLPLTGKMEV